MLWVGACSKRELILLVAKCAINTNIVQPLLHIAQWLDKVTRPKDIHSHNQG